MKAGYLVCRWDTEGFHEGVPIKKPWVTINYRSPVNTYSDAGDQLSERIHGNFINWTLVKYRVDDVSHAAMKADTSNILILSEVEADDSIDNDETLIESILDSQYTQQEILAIRTFAKNELGLTDQDLSDIELGGISRREIIGRLKNKGKSL